ncbi:MarR family winged helix-turn-helix transcriptional regulator [Companilactobacillus sp. HBUAS59699]|uniref:MarR family winged helix-turn-helix transcriptional regulator n=1 Tax=Companilactobacillus sp. HBUAS59699 TaxID=3109358 RepID=UPI002FF26F3A
MNENDDFFTFIKTTVRLARAIQSEMYEGAKDRHITKLEIDILMVIWVSEHHQCKPADLMDFLKITKSQLSRSLSALGEKGFIEKQRDTKNKKFLIISLTKAGKTLVVKNAINVKSAMVDEMKKLSIDDRQALRKTINF